MFSPTVFPQGDTGLGNKVFFDFMTEKKTILMLGPSRSNVAESVGASAKYFNVVQVSKGRVTRANFPRNIVSWKVDPHVTCHLGRFSAQHWIRQYVASF